MPQAEAIPATVAPLSAACEHAVQLNGRAERHGKSAIFTESADDRRKFSLFGKPMSKVGHFCMHITRSYGHFRTLPNNDGCRDGPDIADREF
jgi:hypothetical protein